MPVLLEVIVTSLAEAIEAERGGADRVELVRALELGGLTPEHAVVEEVVNGVRIPVRVMVRENAGLAVESAAELQMLADQVGTFAGLPVDGLVLGFVQHGELDLVSTTTLLARAPNLRATFHRAFDEVRDPLAAIELLKGIPQIDRILTSGGNGSVPARIARLRTWQKAAAPGIRLLAGIGLSPAMLDPLKADPLIEEVHVGRAARVPQDVSGSVDRNRVAALKSALA